jgi:nucleotide-binding universal stress UspA family protein
VTVIRVDDGSIAAPAGQGPVYLSRHGIHADVECYGNGDAAEILLDQCVTGCFVYLVMGAFGHRRFVEALLGGVTRKVLGECPIPILLAH